MSARRSFPWAAGLLAVLMAITAACGGADDETAAPSQALDGYVLVAGQRIHFKVQGEGDEVLILLHGFGGNAFSFRHQMGPLSTRRRVYAVDLLGFGYSDRPLDGDYSLAGQARLVAGFMDALKIERAAVAGHSIGGAVALRLALDYPQKVTRLILIDPALGGGGEETGGDFMSRMGGGLVGQGRDPVEALVRQILLNSYYDDSLVTEEVVEGYARPLRDIPLDELVALLAKMARDNPGGSAVPDAERVRQPVLVVWGAEDEIIPIAGVEDLRRRIPHAQVEIVEAAGHLPMEEKPDIVNDLIRAFLKTD